MQTRTTQRVSNLTVCERAIPRKAVDFEAEAQIGDLLILGKIRDFHSQGVFFEPTDMAYVDGEFGDGQNALEALRPGDVLNVYILDSKGNRGIKLEAHIRWMGQSMAHGCAGFGACYDVCQPTEQYAQVAA